MLNIRAKKLRNTKKKKEEELGSEVSSDFDKQNQKKW